MAAAWFSLSPLRSALDSSVWARRATRIPATRMAPAMIQSTAVSDRSTTGSVGAALDATKKTASSTPQSYPADRMGHAGERGGTALIPVEGLAVQAGRDGVAHGSPRGSARAVPGRGGRRTCDVGGAGGPYRAARALA